MLPRYQKGSPPPGSTRSGGLGIFRDAVRVAQTMEDLALRRSSTGPLMAYSLPFDSNWQSQYELSSSSYNHDSSVAATYRGSTPKEPITRFSTKQHGDGSSRKLELNTSLHSSSNTVPTQQAHPNPRQDERSTESHVDSSQLGPVVDKKILIHSLLVWFREWLENTGYKSASGGVQTCGSRSASRDTHAKVDAGSQDPANRSQNLDSKRRPKGDDTDDEDGSKRNRKKTRENFDVFSAPKRYACPFFKRNPYKLRAQPSCTHSWPNVSRIKEHVYRQHRLPDFQCQRCGVQFETAILQLTHQRQVRPCNVQPSPLQEGITLQMFVDLRDKRLGRGASEEDKWRTMYRVIFPLDDPARYPSPYDEPSCDVSLDSRRHLADFSERVLPSIVEESVNAVEASDSINLSPESRGRLRTEIERRLSDALDIFRSGDDHTRLRQPSDAPCSLHGTGNDESQTAGTVHNSAPEGATDLSVDVTTEQGSWASNREGNDDLEHPRNFLFTFDPGNLHYAFGDFDQALALSDGMLPDDGTVLSFNQAREEALAATPGAVNDSALQDSTLDSGYNSMRSGEGHDHGKGKGIDKE
ncbi:hypothetical protein BJ170DRAFT_277775 [Xylariales sp. AK1849]|nr:hypothetical protein BJ170DRAFT_277775 [Xylariales sp. AK1849]